MRHGESVGIRKRKGREAVSHLQAPRENKTIDGGMTQIPPSRLVRLNKVSVTSVPPADHPNWVGGSVGLS